MSTVEIERRAAGTSEGGQFAPRAHSAPQGATLAESATGSFAFPPDGFTSGNEMGEFFMNAPISDQILSNALYAYARWQRETDVQERLSILMNDNKVKRLESEDFHEFLQVRDDLLAKARFDSQKHFTPKSLPASGARAILRAHQIWNTSQILPPAEEKIAEEYPVTFRGRTMTAKDLAAHYQTGRWIDGVLSESDLAVHDAVSQTIRR